jgi:hypothetical protein
MNALIGLTIKPPSFVENNAAYATMAASVTDSGRPRRLMRPCRINVTASVKRAAALNSPGSHRLAHG